MVAVRLLHCRRCVQLALRHLEQHGAMREGDRNAPYVVLHEHLAVVGDHLRGTREGVGLGLRVDRCGSRTRGWLLLGEFVKRRVQHPVGPLLLLWWQLTAVVSCSGFSTCEWPRHLGVRLREITPVLGFPVL